MASKRRYNFTLNGEKIRLTDVRKDIVVSGFKLDQNSKKLITDKLEKRVNQKAVDVVDGHYNSVLDVVKRVTNKGVRYGRASQIAHRMTRKGTGGRTSVVVALQWAPLQRKYQLRKAREKQPGRGRFWKYTGDLATEVASIPDVKSSAKFKYNGKSTTRKGSHEFRVTVKLGKLNEPMQGLMRRSFLEGTPSFKRSGANKAGDSKLGLLYQLEVGGVGKAGWTRPFITEMSAKMGAEARKRLGNIKF